MFDFLYMLGGLNNLFLLKKLESAAMKSYSYLLINMLIFGTCFGVNFFLTFLPSIISTGVVVALLAVSYFMIPAKKYKSEL